MTVGTRTLDHLLLALERTDVHESPFSHFYVEDALPADVYAALLDRLPDATFYRPDNPRKPPRPDGQPPRSVMGLDDASLGRLEAPDRELWCGVRDALIAPELQRRIFRMLRRDLCRRFWTSPRRLDRVRAYPQPGLVRDLGGYAIEPHPDTRAKIVTMQLYLARDESQLDLGTALYRPRLWRLRNLVNPAGALVKCKQFPFKPNSGYAFAVSWKSWHGREPVPEASGVRHSLLHFYFRDPRRGW
jgi:hypothetical protein